VIKVIIAIGFLGWLFPVPIVVLMGMSRALFALSSDRVLPESVASVAKPPHACGRPAREISRSAKPFWR